jgi:hypothetical protein
VAAGSGRSTSLVCGCSAPPLVTLREMPINDFFAKNGKLREDGRMVHDMYD